MRFHHRKPCMRRAAVRKVRFDCRKPCRRLAEVWVVRFDHRNTFRRLAEVGECVLTSAKRVGSLYSREGAF